MNFVKFSCGSYSRLPKGSLAWLAHLLLRLVLHHVISQGDVVAPHEHFPPAEDGLPVDVPGVGVHVGHLHRVPRIENIVRLVWVARIRNRIRNLVFLKPPPAPLAHLSLVANVRAIRQLHLAAADWDSGDASAEIPGVLDGQAGASLGQAVSLEERAAEAGANEDLNFVVQRAAAAQR